MPTACGCAPVSIAPTRRELRDMNAADFGDLLLWPASPCWPTRATGARWAGRFDCVLADEFQDVNRAQYHLAALPARDHGEIFVVGDDSQVIYSWRGSDIGYIRRFQQDFPVPGWSSSSRTSAPPGTSCRLPTR